MKFRCLTALPGLFAGMAAAWAQPEPQVHNAWPIAVGRDSPAGRTESWTAGGPLFFQRPAPEGGTESGLRPLWVQTTDARGDFRSALFLYPIFSYRAEEENYRWSILELINRTGQRRGAPVPASELMRYQTFDLWPFWFSRNTGEPASSYHALFPVAGTIKNRFGYQRLSWFLLPLYGRAEKHGATTTAIPWPFVRVTKGAAHGFALWPLFGWQERPGVSRDEFYLWPLGYNNTKLPPDDAPAGTPPVREYAALPFYAHAAGPGYRGETYLWPFFGYTDRTQPQYHETRYLWPFFVQGRGVDHYENLWGPFYTHSIIHGYDKTWILWPVWKDARWTSEGVAQTKQQLLYFLYWSRTQRSPTHPNLPVASIRHVWPLVSVWDNGAGRQQWQFPSPLEVFFPGNEKVRATWTPFFSLVRHDRRAPGDVHTSILWDGVTWDRNDAEQRSEFHLGPLFSVVTRAGEKRVALGHGLVSWRRSTDGGWRLFWLDFRSKPATVSASPAP